MTVLLVGQRAVPAATKAAAVAALTVGALLVGPALVARLERAAGFADGASPSGRRC